MRTFFIVLVASVCTVVFAQPEGFEWNQSSMQAFYFVFDAQVDGVSLENGDWIAAFNGDVCVGSTEWTGPYTTLPAMGYSASEPGTEGYCVGGTVPTFQIYDASADAFLEAEATPYDGSLEWEFLAFLNISMLSAGSGGDIEGCMDDTACNFNPDATIDDGSCLYDDCNGDCGGEAFVDDCGDCVGGLTGLTANYNMDCNGDCYGSAYIDECGFCVGGNTGEEPCAMDCNGEWGGTAFYDDCGECVGGSTGLTENYAMDDCGVCFGNNEDMDCNGDCFGDAFINDCGCVGGNTGLEPDFCEGCTDETAINYDPEATVDDGSCVYTMPAPEGFEYSQSIQQAFYYFAIATLNDVELTSEDWIGAFNGDICVGSVQWTGPYSVLPVMGDDGNDWTEGYMLTGEFPSFRIYEAASGEVYEATPSEDIAWSNLSQPILDYLAAYSTILGCTDESACNFNPDATEDDGSCLYDDCNGDCGGSAVIDDCGVCSGGNSGHEFNSDIDCNGDCFGSAMIDDCGECTEGQTGLEYNYAMDCTGTCYGEAVVDDCGICSGGTSGHEFNSDMDCEGVCWGEAVLDDCGVCSGGTTGHEFNSDIDCNGDCFGTAVIDDCGECTGGLTGLEFNYALDDCGVCFGENADMDCNGDCFGSAMIDDCGECTEGQTGLEYNYAMDCTGTCYGEAVVDDCGICSGGTSGHEFNSDMDCEGVCWGEAVLDDCGVCSGGTTGHEFNSDIDCNGDCFGTAVIDDCGECTGGLTGLEFNYALDDCGVCFGENADMDCNGDCFGSAMIDDCGECTEGQTGLEYNYAMDCTGTCYGEAVVDDCGVCSGGTTGHEFNSDMDCAGVCFGTAYVDDCGVCDDDPTNDNECFGCTDPMAYNFDDDATIDDGSCIYQPDEFDFTQSTMQAFYFVFYAAINDVELENGDWIGAFNGDICVGSTPYAGIETTVPAMGADGQGGTEGYMTSGDVPTFIVYDLSADAFYEGTPSTQMDLGWANLGFFNIESLLVGQDCAGVVGGSAYIDDCGYCVGGTTGLEPNFAMDCAGVCFGEAVIDDCGECVEGTTGLEFNFAMDCAGECYGDAVIDDCGVCSGGTSGHEANSDQDCAGECFGEAVIDDCGECVGGSTGLEFNYAQDCAGDCFGEAVIDDCGECVGGSTGLEFNYAQDCAGDCFGEAVIDDCGVCSGGSTGHEFNSDMDCAGVCFGNAYVDDCGVCDDDPTNDNECFGCTDPMAYNYDEGATIDDGTCIYMPEGFDFAQSTMQAFYFVFYAAITGEELEHGDWIGAFNGDICVGSTPYAGMETTVPAMGYDGQTATEGYMITGDIPTFIVYDLSADAFYEGAPVTQMDLAWANFGFINIDELLVGQDCAGVIGGTAYFDDCGECVGGSTGLEENYAMDCAGVCFGEAVIDDCGECVGGTTGLEFNYALDDCGVCFGENADMDCAGVCFGEAVIDDCGECVGGTTGLEFNYAQDCAGDCFGSAVIDDCGVCSEGTTGHEFNSDQDCFGTCFGTAFIDDCGECVGGETGMEENWAQDCAGVCFGSAFLDDCGVCSGGQSGHAANSDIDCNGDCFGEAFIDDCGYCTGGNTGLEANFAQDCTGTCFGSAVIDDCGECVEGTTGLVFNYAMDCAGDCFGDAVIDDCGICSGGSTGHEFNSDIDCFGECFGTAFIDECGECVGGETGLEENWAQDCAGICFGNAFIDDCGICSGGQSGHVANSDEDCNGDCFGDAFIDDCGTCVGGETGMEENWAQDCAGICFGAAFLDDCGVCSGGQSGHTANSDEDCNGDCFGNAFIDNCGECVGGETGLEAEWAMDCNEDCFGSAIIDDCGECTGGQTGLEFNFALDDCGICFGENADQDCFGTCFGSAVIDDCGECVEGETGLTFNYAYDDCGICFGDNLDKDCFGDCFGTAVIDDCGECVLGNTGLEFNYADVGCGCFEPAPVGYYPDVDNDGLGYGEETVLFCVDPGVDWSLNNDDLEPLCPTNDTDDCGVCGGGNADKDCNDVCFGGAVEDECGVCEGDGSSCNQPVAVNQSETTLEEMLITITVNAEDPNTDPLDIIITDYPLNGSLNYVGTGLDIDYTPDTDFVGSDNFSYRVTDGIWESNRATVSISVGAVDDPPTVVSYSASLIEDHSLSIGLIASDMDTPDDELVIEIVDNPVKGVLEVSRAFANVEYTALPDEFGADSFTYRAWDGNSYSELGTISITIAPVNDAPVITDIESATGSFVIDENTSLAITVYADDVDGDELGFSIVSGPMDGEVVMDRDFGFTYYPDPGFADDDNIVVQVYELYGTLTSNMEDIEITVSNVNDIPVCEDLPRSVLEDAEELEITLIGDDNDDDDVLSFPADMLSQPAHGTISINNEDVTYIPDSNYNGPDSFTYQVYDGTAYSGECTVSIDVIPVNDSPTVEEITFDNVDDGFIFELEAEDIDGDPLELMFLPLDNEDNPMTVSGGSVEFLGMTGDNVFQYQYFTGFFVPDEDFILYKASDGVEESEVELITFLIPGGEPSFARDEPVAVNQDIDMREDVCKAISIIGVDINGTFDEFSTVSITEQPTMGYFLGDLVIDLDQSNESVLSFIGTFCPNADAAGLDSLKFVVDNGGTGRVSDPGSMKFNISEENDPPTLNNIDDTAGAEDTEILVPLVFSDPDNILQVTWESTDEEHLDISYDDVNNQLVIVPAPNFNGNFQITVTVTEVDGNDMQSTSKTFNLSVTPVNDRPTLVDPSDQDMLEDSEIIVLLSATDIDGDSIGGFEIVSILDDEGNELEWTDAYITGNELHIVPAENYHGEVTITVLAYDENNLESEAQEFGCLVGPVNDQPGTPEFQDPDPIDENNARSYIEMVFTPLDVDGDDLTVTATTGNTRLFPAGSIVVDPVTAVSGTERTITLTPAGNEYGSAVITVTIADSDVSVTAEFNVVVNEVMDAPVLSEIGVLATNEDQVVTIELSATDVDTDPSQLLFTVSEGVNITTGIMAGNLTVIPEANWNGVEYITVTVSDDVNEDSEIVTVDVSPVNDPPVITTFANGTARTGQLWSYQPGITDIDSEEFTIGLSNAPEGMTAADGIVSWTPESGVTSSGWVTMTVYDDGMASDSELFILSVIQVDCAGVDNGTAVIDDCGVCSGGTTVHPANSDMDCTGLCFGEAYLDDCDVCSGGTSGHEADSDKDCAGTCFGDALVDDCGICSGGTSGHEADSDKDCEGTCFGTAVVDDCGECVLGNTGLEFNYADVGCGCFEPAAMTYYADVDGDGLGDDAVTDEFCGDPGEGWAAVGGDPEPDCATNDTDLCGICGGENANMDCEGICFGNAFVDECGICSGGTTGHAANSDKDCYGECFGEAGLDECGVCSGGSTGLIPNADLDCANVCFGSAFIDNCDICSGGTTGHTADSDMDCAGICFGEAFLDDCDICSEGTTGHTADSDMDCAGVCFGEAVIDDCGVCSGGTTGHEANSNMDCAGECFGDAFLDDCEVCSGGISGHIANSDKDCYGECFGEAGLDECGVCAGGSTGLIPNADMDCAEVCFGSAYVDDCDVCSGGTSGHLADSDKDCAGVCFGEAFIDDCDVCSGGTSGHEADSDKDCAGVCFGEAFIDDCDVCSGGTTGHEADSDKDCAGVCFGEAFIDDCDVCSGGTSGHEADSDKDCAGVCFGEAFIDDCDVCSEGTTGHAANSDMDCNDECFGTAFVNECGCVEGSTGLAEDYCYGCTNPEAVNYDPDATIDDGSCTVFVTTLNELHDGNNLVGFMAIPESPTPANILSPLGDNVIAIIGEGVQAQPHPILPGEWIGSLTEIEATDGYWLRVNTEDVLSVTGYPVDPEIIYELHEGNNLISYVGENLAGVSEALPDDIEPYVTDIIGESLTAQPHPFFPDQWIGSLTQLEQGKGYWMRTSQDITFAWAQPALTRLESYIPVTEKVLPAGFEYNQSTKQAFYYIEQVALTDGDIQAGDWLIAYEGDVVIGARQWTGEYTDIPVMAYDGSIGTEGYLTPGTVPTFKLYNETSGDIINLTAENIPVFESNGVSFITELTEEVLIPDAYALHHAYPNPFNPATTIAFDLPVEGHVNVAVYDMRGRMVAELGGGHWQAGYHKLTWNAEQQASGVYFIRMTSDSFQATRKVMLVK